VSIVSSCPKIVASDVFRGLPSEEDFSEVDAVLYVDVHISNQQLSEELSGLPTYLIFHNHVGIAGKQGYSGSWVEYPLGSNHLLISSNSDLRIDYQHDRVDYRSLLGYAKRQVWIHGTHEVLEIRRTSLKEETVYLLPKNSLELGAYESFLLWWRSNKYVRVIYYDPIIVNAVLCEDGYRSAGEGTTHATLWKKVSKSVEDKYSFLDLMGYSELKSDLVLYCVAAVEAKLIQNSQFAAWSLQFLRFDRFWFWISYLWLLFKWVVSFFVVEALKPKCFLELLNESNWTWTHSHVILKAGKGKRRDSWDCKKKEYKDSNLLTTVGVVETEHWFTVLDNAIRGQQFYYCHWGLAVPWTIYADCGQVRCAAFQRLMVRPLLDIDDQAKAWDGLISDFVKNVDCGDWFFDEIVVSDVMLQDWINKKDSKQMGRYRKCAQTPSKMVEVPKWAIPINPKVDEFTSVTKAPRAIFNVGDEIQVQCGPYVDIAFDHFKEVFHEGKIYHYFVDEVDVPFSFAVGSGRNDHELGKWARQISSYNRGLHIMAAGDDVVAVYYLNGKMRVFCSDFSQYDQSQSFSGVNGTKGPIGFSLSMLNRCGLPDDIVKKLKLCMVRKCKVSCANSDFSQDSIMIYDTLQWPMLATGMPITTASNTIVTLFSTLFAFGYMFELDDWNLDLLSKGFAQLGLSAKIKEYDRLSQADFLKGHFVERFLGEGEDYSWFWYPGLGMLSKFGFSKVDLLTMDEYRGMTLPEAQMTFLSDVALGWSAFLHGPLIRVFIEKWNKPKSKKLNSKYSTRGSGYQVDANLFDWSDYLAYYDIAEEDLLALEDKLMLLPLGHMLDDPILSLLTKDYA
jgi:hypothetical protein